MNWSGLNKLNVAKTTLLVLNFIVELWYLLLISGY